MSSRVLLQGGNDGARAVSTGHFLGGAEESGHLRLHTVHGGLLLPGGEYDGGQLVSVRGVVLLPGGNVGSATCGVHLHDWALVRGQ